MSGYLKTVLTALICISLLSGLLPKEGMGKNVLFCARILAVLLIVSPLLSLRGIDIEQVLSFDTEEIEMLSADFAADAFCETLQERIKEALQKKGIRAEVTVFAETDEEGAVVGVSEVNVKPMTEDIKREIASMLEIEETLVQEAT